MQGVLLPLLLLSVVQSVNAASIITTKYDSYFKDSVIFLPIGTDWRLMKAQCYTESNLNPLAESPVGAMGLCQFMPNTAAEMKSKYPELDNFWLPETSIIAAARYMNQMNNFWSSPRSSMDRWLLAAASYNAGAGNIHKAQKLCGSPIPYRLIIACLPDVTGHHSIETINYNKRILQTYAIILLN